MSEPDPTPGPTDETRARRSRWIGRAVIIGFALLLLAYLGPLFVSLLG